MLFGNCPAFLCPDPAKIPWQFYKQLRFLLSAFHLLHFDCLLRTHLLAAETADTLSVIIYRRLSMAEAVKKYGNPAFNVDRTEVRKNIWTRMAGALNIFQKKPYIEASEDRFCIFDSHSQTNNEYSQPKQGTFLIRLKRDMTQKST